MSEITVQGLLTDAGIIRGEIHDSQNSHDRVGKMFEDIIKYIQAHEGSWATGGGGGGGTSSITGTLLLNGLNGKDNPSLDDQILHWSSNTGWGYITTPTGGSRTGGGVTWQQLDTNTSEQINASHLSNALSNYVAKANMAGINAVYEWWGNKFPATPSNGVYKINGAIEFSNGVRIAPEEGNHTLKIEAWDNSSNPAHIYTTGGVSALGNSSSGGGGGGGGEGTPLNNLLGYINSHDYYGTTGTVSPSTGDTIIYNGTKWKVGSIDLEDLLGTAPAQFVASKILAKDSGDNYKWIDASGIGGSTSITNLWKVGDVGTSTGYSSNIANKHILRYNEGVWENVIFDVSSSLPQGTSSTLACINLAGTNYVLPQANGNVMGIVKAGTGLSASSGTLNHSNAVTAVTSVGLYKLKYDAQGHITGTSSITKADITNLGIPGQDTTYEGRYGITVSSTANSQTGKYPISVDNGAGLTFAAGKLAIDDNYINGKWVTLNTEQIITATKTFTDHQILANDTALKAKDTDGTALEVLSLDALNQLAIGWHITQLKDYDTLVFGNTIKLYSGNAQIGKKEAVRVLPSGVVELALATTGPKSGNTYTGAGPAAGLRIGDAVLYWDEANQALALAKYNESTPSSPTAANFYATGGVSALGMSSGIGTVPTMTFGNLNIDTGIKFENEESSISSINGYLNIDASEGILINTNIDMNGSDLTNVTNIIFADDETRTLTTDGDGNLFYGGVQIAFVH